MDMSVIDRGAPLDMTADLLDQASPPLDLAMVNDLSMAPDQEIEPCGGADDPCPDAPRVEISVTAPVDQMQLASRGRAPLQASLSIENVDPRAIGVYLDSSLQGPLLVTYRPEELTITADLNQLTQGTHVLTLSAFVHPDFEWSTQLTVHVPCVIEADFSEALDPMLWYQMGDAYRAEGGWLEMTDQTPNSVGGIFLVG
jgi:hypothetical protein